MSDTLDKEMENYLRPLFGDMAPLTITSQKEKLGFQGELNQKEYIQVAEEIKKLCDDMAGEVLANKIYTGLLSLIEKNS